MRISPATSFAAPPLATPSPPPSLPTATPRSSPAPSRFKISVSIAWCLMCPAAACEGQADMARQLIGRIIIGVGSCDVASNLCQALPRTPTRCRARTRTSGAALSQTRGSPRSCAAPSSATMKSMWRRLPPRTRPPTKAWHMLLTTSQGAAFKSSDKGAKCVG